MTIKIYDYANNLVKTVTDGAQRDAGRQYDETDIWDGRNGKEMSSQSEHTSS